MSPKRRNTILAIVTAAAFAAGNLLDQHRTGQLTYESASDLGGEALQCYQALDAMVRQLGKETPAGPLAAFCTAVASQPALPSRLPMQGHDRI